MQIRIAAFLLLACAVASAQQAYHELEIIPSQSGTAGEFRFVETNGWTSGTGTGYVGFKGPASIGSNVIWTLPSADGTSGQVLSTNGSGTLSWATASGGSGCTPAGSTDEIQLNDGSGDCAAVTGFTHDGEGLWLPPSATTPTTAGGQFTIVGNTTDNVNFTFDESMGAVRFFSSSSATDRTFSIFNSGSGALNISLEGYINPMTDGAFTLGTAGTSDKRWLSGAFDSVITSSTLLQRAGQASHDYSITSELFFLDPILRIKDSGGSNIISIGAASTQITFNSAYNLSMGDVNLDDLVINGTCTGCGGGLPVVDTTSVVEGSSDATKELRFEVDGFTTSTTRVLTPQNASYTIAGTNIAQTFTATQTMQNVLFDADSTYSVGSLSVRPDSIFSDNVTTEELYLTRQGAGSQDFLIQNTTPNFLYIKNSVGATIWTWDQASPTKNVQVSSAFVPGTNNTYELGLASLRWAKTWTTDLDVSGNTTLSIGTGNFYGKDVGGASSGISCAGVSDGWQGITSDNYFVWCDGGSRYRVAGASY